MRDDRDEGDRDEDSVGASDEGEGPRGDEKGGLGLTEEFARIESDIEREVRGPTAAGDDESAGSTEVGSGGERNVRWEDTDSSEWVAPVEPRRGQETDEWTVAGEGTLPEEDSVTEDELADGTHGDDLPDDPMVDPSPPTEGGSLAEQPADGLAEGPVEEVDAESSAGECEEDELELEVVTGAGVDEPFEDEDEDKEPADDEPPEDPPAQTPTDDEPATEHTIIRPRPLAPRFPSAVAGGGGLIDDAGLNVKTPSLWWRFLTGSILIVVSVATSVALYGLVLATAVAGDFRPLLGTDAGRFDDIIPGEPQTILIVGSDERSETPGDPGRSDTTMLLRVDADKGVLSVFSLPRDLRVEIPNYGTGRLNEAYTVGGIGKTTRTVEALTGLEVDVVVNVDFQGFADAVDAIECVYVDIDRKYFNDNSLALSAVDQYAEIDINAGYQRLCGLDALAYVRYRHEDNDIVRAARQQDFLREARQKIEPSELVFSPTGNDLINIFTKYTRTNVDEASEVIGILKSFITVRDVPIQQVSFEGNLADVDENGVAYVTATGDQIETAVDEFLAGGTTAGPRGDVASEKGGSGDGGGGSAKAKKQKKEPKESEPTDGATVVDADPGFARFGSTSARRLKFPVWVPTVMVPGSLYNSGSRQYEIKDIEDNQQPAYKMVIEYQTPSTLTEYYGVEGTTWSDPPILRKPSESREIDGRSYDLFYDGDRLRLVAWHDADGNSYWVSNTLAHTLEEADMLAIATSMDEAHG